MTRAEMLDELIKTLEQAQRQIHLIRHTAWCEGRDAAEAEIQKRWDSLWCEGVLADDILELIRALKSPYEAGNDADMEARW